MKMRTINLITAGVTVIASILALIAVQTGMHTVFGTVAACIALAVSLGMYLRVFIGTAALKSADHEEELVRIAIGQKKDENVVRQFAEWIRTGSADFDGALICDLWKAVDDNDDHRGYWILLIGTQSSYKRILNEVGDKAMVLDSWPIDNDEWADSILKNMLPEPPEIEDDDIIPELKG